MPPPIKTANPYKIAGELRRSQILTTFGPGAIVDLPRFSGIMAGIDSWKIERFPDPEKAKIHERNLEKLLGKDYFIQVSSPETESGSTFGLRAYRFPNWYYCPECHHLDEDWKIALPTSSNISEKNSPLYCNNREHKKTKLIPSRFIAACPNGHIQDFPYIWWAHKQNGKICEVPALELHYIGTTGSLDSIHIKCTKCEAHNTMLGCMNEDALKGMQCHGNSPWLGLSEKGWYKDPVPCSAKLRVLQRSANNVYYPVNQSALTIPPWSAKIQSVLASKVGKFEHIFEHDEEEISRLLKSDYSRHSDEYGCDETTFIKEAHKRYGENPSDEKINIFYLRCEEYKAFCGEDKNEDCFKTETTPVPDDFTGFFSKIKMVKKLREVMVLQGFKRIDPAVIRDEDERKRLGLSNNEFAPISKQPLEWLPAIELFGEGIFLQFNEEAVRRWEKLNSTYYEKMGKNLAPGWEWGNMFNFKEPRFVLLHTFAHLLIRQLTAQCGYATASIKERIYSTFNGNNEKMCGILIYTSATDTDGSLGGLVREGESVRINNTIKGLLEESSWCSNDPICIESKNQGFRGLNYASCHACTLLPETSCEHFNCLLDRASITGLPDGDNKDIAFFKDLLIG